jgi:ATP-dependent Clp protease ATP-binding subunit ClpB
VVVFHRLSRENLKQIVDIQVATLAKRVEERGITIDLTDEARELLGDLGFDPTYGARPLKRVIQKNLIDALALKLLESEFSDGDVVKVDAKDGELTFKKAAKAKGGKKDEGKPPAREKTAV